MADITPVLFARFFLFVVQVPFATYEERVTHWWYYFRHHQLAPSVGNVAHYRFLDKRVTWYSLAQWRPLMTFKKKKPLRLRLKDR